MMCPAAGKNATVSCPLKASHVDPKSDKALTPNAKSNILPEGMRGKICINKSSVHFDPRAGAKWAQAVPYGTPEHKAWYGLRTVVEGYNGYAKNNPEQLGDSGRRQLRGHAAQYLLTAFLITGINLRKVQSFLQERTDGPPTDIVPVELAAVPPATRSPHLTAWLPKLRSTALMLRPVDTPIQG